jgi:Domain of unknown function (DUF4157)/D-alanyl-D-alanine carboxypeptidase/Zinc carboxypeptidase
MHPTHAKKPAPANLAPKATQAKLRISSPTDTHELAAEAVAGKVMRMAAPGTANDCGCGGTCTDCAGGGHHDEKLHTSRADHGGSHPTLAPPIVHEVLRSPGRSLDQTTRNFMEPRFGHDFSRVRIHTDIQAAASARAVHAKAYTVDHDIVFAAGQYDTNSEAGKTLLAHELAHVTQQRRDRLNRSADFNIGAIAADLNTNSQTTVPIGSQPVNMALLYFKYNAHASGEIAKAADYLTKYDKTKPKDIPPPDADPPLSNIPIEAHFFPTAFPTKGRALVLGGFHGKEHPGWQVTDALVKELSAPGGSSELGFNTIVVPRVNAGAIQDELAGTGLGNNRCNRQMVDLNRNFPTGGKASDTDCQNTDKAPRQPEIKALINLIQLFKPDRILSTHAVHNDPKTELKKKSGGIFADPNNNPEAIKLASGMASTVVHPDTDIPHNKLGTGANDFNPVYPLDTPGKVSGGTTLGAWAPDNAKRDAGGQTPVITMEAQDFRALDAGPGTDKRTVEGYLRPVRAFLADPSTLATRADWDIVGDIMSFNAADKIGLLTGRLSPANDIYRRIQFRVDTAIAKLNGMKPPEKIKRISEYRAFSGDSAQNNATIVFEKFFLTGSRGNGWDTLPDQYFKNGNRSKGVDRAAWLAEPSKKRLDIILQFSALPGTSRHHWGTDVDFNSITNAEWEPPVAGKKGDNHFALRQWLEKNASSAGMIQSYTPGRTGGYGEEPWHYSYAPIAIGLRELYNSEVKLQQDVIDPLVADFTTRASKIKQPLPSDFATALGQIDIPSFVNDIAPALKPK